MKPIAYKKEDTTSEELIAEDGTVYVGEYTDMRIDRDTLPEGKFAYECRHGDEGDWVTPETIENRVLINFAGTFITDKEIPHENIWDLYIALKVEHEDEDDASED